MGTVGRRWLRSGERVPDDQKWCNWCKSIRPKTEFGKHKSGTDGLRGRCKECESQREKEYKERFPQSERHRCRRYRLKLGEFDAMCAAQDFRCASCGDPLQEGRMTHLDHCHTTKKIRGILCLPCNLALGYLKDDPDRIDALNAYLSRVD